MELVHNNKHSSTLVSSWFSQLGSVAGPIIQANGRLEFEDGLRTGAIASMEIGQKVWIATKYLLLAGLPAIKLQELFCQPLEIQNLYIIIFDNTICSK